MHWFKRRPKCKGWADYYRYEPCRNPAVRDGLCVEHLPKRPSRLVD